MAVIQIKDANNKEFSIDDTKIFDINGDIGENESRNISDSLRNRVHVQNDVQYVNANGEVIDANQLLRDSASGKVNIIALDVETEATHSGKNHNYCIYYEDSMEKDAESFTNPFNKPMLKNHDSYSEPLGRIKQSWFGPSQLTDERSAIHLKTRVTDKDAIEKFLDGRYSTVSIGGSMGTVTCNICGKTILKDGKFKFCGHWRGETYKDQVCYWGARDIEYHEVSTVNNPADDFAQVVKVTVITDEDKEKNDDNNKGGVGDMGEKNTQNNSQSDQRNKLVAMIDELLGNSDTKTEDSSTSTTNSSSAQQNDNDNTNNTGTVTDNNTSDVNKQLEDANQKITDLEKQLADANKAKEEAEAKLADAEKAKEEAVQDSIAMKDQCIELALANKKLIADQIIELEIAQKKLEDSKTSERQKELVSQSMKDLQATFDSIKKNETSTATDSTQRQQAQAQNPTLANAGEQNSTVTDANGNPVGSKTDGSVNQKAKVEDSNKKKSIDDYTNDIIKKISKR